MRVFPRIVDAIDVETFLLCESEAQGKRLARALMDEMGLKDSQIVFLKKQGPGVRVRLRATVHRPGDEYGWLQEVEE